MQKPAILFLPDLKNGVCHTCHLTPALSFSRLKNLMSTFEKNWKNEMSLFETTGMLPGWARVSMGTMEEVGIFLAETKGLIA